MANCYVKAYFDWIEQTAALSDAERGRLFIAILEYARSGLDPKLDGREGILFPVFKSQLDRDAKKAKASAENGKAGGRPASENNLTKPNHNLTEPNETKEKATKDIRHKTKDKDKENIHFVNNTPHTPLGGRFDDFWAEYPKKVGKGAAEKAFERIKPDKQTFDRMIAAVNAQKQSHQWRENNGQYIPNPATWLNQRRWEDEPTQCVENQSDLRSFDLELAQRMMEENA